MLVACRCLNVVAAASEGPQVPPDGLPGGVFFEQKLGLVQNCNVCCEKPILLKSKEVSQWIVFYCLLCRTFTHATHLQIPQQMLINLELITDNETIAALKKSGSFSPTFKLLLNSANNDPVVKESLTPINQVTKANLLDYMTNEIESKKVTINDEITQFQESKSCEFLAFKVRAFQDYQKISSALSYCDNLPEEPRSHLVEANVVIRNSENVIPAGDMSPNNKKSILNTTLTSNSKQKNNAKNLPNISSYQEDSLDSEGIFDLEGMDSSTSPYNGANSDTSDSDMEDSTSRDEGIVIARKPNDQSTIDMVRSVPVNIPNFMHLHEHSQDRIDRNDEDGRDIAASIRALARSACDLPFGDLPRPRFSTQI